MSSQSCLHNFWGITHNEDIDTWFHLSFSLGYAKGINTFLTKSDCKCIFNMRYTFVFYSIMLWSSYLTVSCILLGYLNISYFSDEYEN